jgi:hypothetical protein
MYDGHIQGAARRAHVRPISFEHPLRNDVLSLFESSRELVSVILTGDAGDGKTHLCRAVWQKLMGEKGAERLLGRGHLLAKLEGCVLAYALLPFVHTGLSTASLEAIRTSPNADRASV